VSLVMTFSIVPAVSPWFRRMQVIWLLKFCQPTLGGPKAQCRRRSER
jgi:hypothetical protein